MKPFAHKWARNCSHLAMLIAVTMTSSIAHGTEDSIDTAFLRSALVVSDVESSKHFYTYALGFEAGFDGDISRPAVLEQLQLEAERKVHFVVLRGSDKVSGRDLKSAMIGLLHVDNPPLPKMQRPGPSTLATGEGMLALVSSDIDLVYSRMQELGVHILLPPTPSADGSESELVAYDPDGIRIHVVQMHSEP